MRYFDSTNRSILREMVSADFKVRYQGSILGYLWSLLRPLFLFAILYIVFTKIFNVGKGIEHFPVYLLLGIIIWNYFVEATVVGMGSVVAKGDMLRKVPIPRYLVVVSATLSATINLFLNLAVFFVLATLNGVTPMLSWLLFPILLIQLFILTLSVAFFLSAVFVRFRDTSYIWEVLLQAGFYATAVIYPLSLVAEKYHGLFLLSPMTQIIQDSRYVLVNKSQTIIGWGTQPWYIVAAPIVITISIFIVALFVFRSQSKSFAENV